MTLKEKLDLCSEPVFLMDGTAFIYRGFYANRHLQRSDGYPTNALVVVTRILLRILRQENPRYFLFAMDGRGKTFRHSLYDQYKANREAMPEDLGKQIEPIKEMVKSLGLPLMVCSGFEADDCIASLAFRFRSDHPIVIISGDKDLKQCLEDSVFMWDPASREEKLLTKSVFEEETGISPAQWPDMQALIGDSSDNIPGVPGIGPKTAIQIFRQYPNLEAIYEDRSKLPQKLCARLEPHLEEMFRWRELTTLKTDECQNLGLSDLRVGSINLKECSRLADEFELFAVRREIASVVGEREKDLPADTGTLQPECHPGQKCDSGEEQLSLFGSSVSPQALPISSPVNLPSCDGVRVALVWPDGYHAAPCVYVQSGHSEIVDAKAEACAENEFFWGGTSSELCAWLADASEVIVPDLKSLLVNRPSWRKLEESGCKFFDMGLGAYLLNPEAEEYAWPRLAMAWKDKIDVTAGAGLPLAIASVIKAELAANGLMQLYEEVELPLVHVLADMEERGVAISPAAFESFLKDVESKAARMSGEVFNLAGEKFNLRSSRQLGEVLFDKMKLPAPRKTKGGQYSTSEATLEKLAAGHPIVESILEFRKLEKMRSTYLDPFPKLMDAHNRIHTTFNQEATATGRLSSSNPNLQNIPVRGPLGTRMRSCFVPIKDNLLVAADYSQIELRILAHLSQDRHLLEAFKNNEDIHARTASLVFERETASITPDERRMAKTINFGLLYGMGATKLAQELKITNNEAREFIEKYFAHLTGLKQFYENIIERARERGYVQTMVGRRRWLPGIYSANNQISAQAQRQAVNTVIQGSAADIIKLAMISVANDARLEQLKARLVLQVHDELLLEVPEANSGEAARIVQALMESVQPAGIRLAVPLKVDCGIGANWGEAH